MILVRPDATTQRRVRATLHAQGATSEGASAAHPRYPQYESLLENGDASPQVGLPGGLTLAAPHDMDMSSAAASEWVARAAWMVRTHGAVIVTDVLSRATASKLAQHHASLSGSYDTTNTTLSPVRRRHVAVSLRELPVTEALAQLARVVWPVACHALAGDSDNSSCAGSDDSLRIIESGLLVSEPGAAAQQLHTDTSHQAEEASVLKIQVAAIAIDESMGPIEILPGSAGAPPTSLADAPDPLPLPLPVGAALIYDARTWHRGGANKSRRARPVHYVAILREPLGTGRLTPAGLPYTIEPTEIGCFRILPDGVALKPTAAAEQRRGQC